MNNSKHFCPNGLFSLLLKRAQFLALIVLGGITLVARVSAQSFVTANSETGSIRGTVVDTSDDPIPGASVVLQSPAGDRLTAVTKDDGAFVIDQAPAGVAYQVSVTADGFAPWSSSVTVGASHALERAPIQVARHDEIADLHNELLCSTMRP